MIYLFSSANSFNSILTIDKKSKGENHADSIFEMAAEKGLDKVFLIEKNPSSFPQALKNSNAAGLQLIYGLKLTVCEDSDQKDENSVLTEHKLMFVAKSGRGYKNCLMKLYSDAATRGNFNGLPRTDFNRIKHFWTEDMLIMVPFYDSFIYENLVNFKSCAVDFGSFNPVFCIEHHDLPLDKLIAKKVKEFCKEKYKTLDTHTVYYKNKEDAIPYLVYRCIQNRSSVEVPQLDGMASKEFYLK